MSDKIPFVEINGHRIGAGHPTYVVAELSANHNGSFEQAAEFVRVAKASGADAVKLQTYTPDTMTIDSDEPDFQIPAGNTWEGRTLYDLYGEAYTPWEWHPKLQRVAEGVGIDLFSSPFDASAVEFLEGLGMPAYKVASFEIVDIPLIRQVARTGKPLIISTGMATLEEIQEAVEAAREEGAREIVLLKCTSAYPSPPEEMNLASIPHLAATFDVPAGLSDHTRGVGVPLAGVALGAVMIEKHVTLSRSVPGPDAAFSLEPDELAEMVRGIRIVEKAIGHVDYTVTEAEQSNWVFRRSLFVTAEMKQGDEFTQQNVRSVRPGFGLKPRHLPDVLGRHAAKDIKRGTALDWTLVR